MIFSEFGTMTCMMDGVNGFSRPKFVDRVVKKMSQIKMKLVKDDRDNNLLVFSNKIHTIKTGAVTINIELIIIANINITVALTIASK